MFLSIFHDHRSKVKVTRGSKVTSWKNNFSGIGLVIAQFVAFDEYIIMYVVYWRIVIIIIGGLSSSFLWETALRSRSVVIYNMWLWVNGQWSRSREGKRSSPNCFHSHCSCDISLCSFWWVHTIRLSKY